MADHTPLVVDEPLALVASEGMDDWWCIERAEHDERVWLEDTGPGVRSLRTSARISDADVEGTSADMARLAMAITQRDQHASKRCAVAVDAEAGTVQLWSPRNSQRPAEVPLARVDALAEAMLAQLHLQDVARPQVVDTAQVQTVVVERPPPSEPHYLGDGLYVHTSGNQLVLTANHHEVAQATDTVYLEPAVFSALKAYVLAREARTPLAAGRGESPRRWLRQGRLRWGRFTELVQQLRGGGFNALADWLEQAP